MRLLVFPRECCDTSATQRLKNQRTKTPAMPITPRRQCEMKIPDPMVEVMDKVPGGIQPILRRVEKDFGLSTSSSYLGKKNYFIIGPNPEILELTLETLKYRYMATPKSDVKDDEVVKLLDERKAVWRFQGDYSTKLSHLYRQELDQLTKKTKSVEIIVTPLCVEINCSYDDAERVKADIENIQAEIDGLYEEDIGLNGSANELVRLKKFIRSKQKQDRSVVCVFSEKFKRVTIYGKSETSVKRAIGEWKMWRETPLQETFKAPSGKTPIKTSSPQKYKDELKLPGGLLKKLENQRGGIETIIFEFEKEYGLKIVYHRRKSLTIFGPNSDILELAAQTLVHKYILHTPQEHGVLGHLQGPNVVWKFLGGYAKKVSQLFKTELKRIRRIKTVTIKHYPSRVNPTCVEILCSTRVIERVKAEVEKLVGLVHGLFEAQTPLPKEPEKLAKIKGLVQERMECDDSIVCIVDEKKQVLAIYGTMEAYVKQVMEEINIRTNRRTMASSLPREYWNSYRQLYQTKVDGALVQRLEELPDGIIPVITKIEKEYGVKAMYLRSKQMILISPAAEILELVHETLETRFLDNQSEKESQTRQKTTAPVMEVLREEDEDNPDSGVDDDTFQEEEDETVRTEHQLPPLNNSHRSPRRTVNFIV